MATELTQAILIEIIEMLQMVNKTIIDLTDDILRDEIVRSNSADAEEIMQWSDLYGKTAEALRNERRYVKELEDRVWQLETELFASITKP